MAERVVESPRDISYSGTEDNLLEARLRLLDHVIVGGEFEEDTQLRTEDYPHHYPNLNNINRPRSTIYAPDSQHLPINYGPMNLQNGYTQNGYPPQNGYPSINPQSGYGTFPNQTPTNRNKPESTQKKRYRLPFLILLASDWLLTIFFSIIVLQHETVGDYIYLNIRSSYFDLVIISTFRTALNLLFYLVLGWVTRLIMGLTTIVSAIYIPIKAFYTWSNINISSNDDPFNHIAILMMLLVTFGMPLITAFFFEFKYLPSELARLDIPNWKNWTVWLWPRALVKTPTVPDDTPSLQEVTQHHPLPYRLYPSRAGLTASNVSLDYRTPMGSSRGSPVPFDRRGEDDLAPIHEDLELTSSASYTPTNQMSPEDIRLKREALSTLESFQSIVSRSGWNKDRDAQGTVISSLLIEGKKVWKAEIVINSSAEHLFNVLYPGETTPEWNQQCSITEVIHQVDRNTDVVYSCTKPMGPISSRDFLSIRLVEEINGNFYIATKSVKSALRPNQPGKVRAENGPCGYLISPINTGQSNLVWILNSDLKGWLPQSLIDQNVTSVMLSSLEKLQVYAQENIGTLRK